MATHGTMKAFNAQVDEWPIYVEWLQHSFVANDVMDAGKKRSLLLTVCGTPMYKLLRSLVKDGNLSAYPLRRVGEATYTVKTSVIVRRFHFNMRTRASGESIASYVAALCELALHCEYKDKLPEMLRDRLVCTHFEVDRCSLNVLDQHSTQILKEVLDKHAAVFAAEVGCLKDMPVKLKVCDGTKPKFFKPRPVPLSLKEKVERELTKLENQGIISPTKSSPWAAPVAPVRGGQAVW